MINENLGVIFTFCIYFLFMFSIGIYFYRRTRNISDFILGGRKLGSWVVSMSAQASDMSGWLLMGLPGLAYIIGLNAGWIAIGLIVGTYLNWKIIAKRLRVYTEVAGDSLTLPDYFENRFKDKSKILRVISAVFILIFFLIYTSSGFVAGAKLFSTIFSISYNSGLILAVIVIILFTFLGGFLAVCWLDFFQGIQMFIAVTIVPLIAIYTLGGIGQTVDSIRIINPNMLNIFTELNGSSIGLISLISSLGWGLGYFGQPHILVRFMSISSPNQIKKSRRIAMTWVIISLSCAVVIGMVGMVFFKNQLSDTATETVFMYLVERLCNPFVAGIFLAAILAAIMSTADSQLLVTSSALSEDFYKVMIRKKAKDRELVWVSRLAVILVAVFAYIIALNPNNSVLELVSYAWAGFGSTFGPLILISLFWKRMTLKGAIAGIIIGGITTIIWKHLNSGIFDLYEIVPGFLLSSIFIFVVSLLDKKPIKTVMDEFEKVQVIIKTKN